MPGESPAQLQLQPSGLEVELVVGDDQVGGGLAGHNGLRSIAQVLGTNEFARLRIGVGKPPRKEQGAEYVLQRPTGARKAALRNDVATAADALEVLLDYDFDDAQQRVNAARG